MRTAKAEYTNDQLISSNRLFTHRQQIDLLPRNARFALISTVIKPAAHQPANETLRTRKRQFFVPNRWHVAPPVSSVASSVFALDLCKHPNRVVDERPMLMNFE